MNEINLNSDDDYKDYSERRNKKSAIIFVVAIAVIVGIILSIVIVSSDSGDTQSEGTLTYSNYLKIHDGMTYNEVVDLLGSYGSLDSSSSYGGYTLAYYSWSNAYGTRCIVVGFENGKVCAKSQYGLD